LLAKDGVEIDDVSTLDRNPSAMPQLNTPLVPAKLCNLAREILSLACFLFSSALGFAQSDNVYDWSAQRKMLQGNYEGAISDCAKGIQATPADAKVLLVHRATAELFHEDFDGAERDSASALALDSKYAPAYVTSARAKSAKRNFEGGLADFDSAIALDPTLMEAYAFRSRAKYATGDIGGAIADMDTSIALRPREPSLHRERGEFELVNGNYTKAVADADAALALRPNDPLLTFFRGWAKECAGQTKASIPDLDRAIQLNPSIPEVYSDRGMAREILGDYAGALADYHHAVEVSKDDIAAAYPRIYSYVCSQIHGYRSSVSVLDDLSALKASWPRTVALYLSKKCSESEFFAAAQKGAPQDVKGQNCEAFYYAAMARRISGDSEGSKAMLKKCVGTGVRNFLEYCFARAELKRMGVNF
jgi:tetratricopeptide (TPR) repeat protein